MPPLLWPMMTGGGVAALRQPARGDAIVLDRLGRGLERAALGDAAIAGAEDVVAAAVEGEEDEPEARQHGRQEARRADIEVHRVAVEVERRAA